MKPRWIRLACLAILLILIIIPTGCREEDPNVTNRLRDLGIPLLSTYSDESEALIRARCSWDMIAYDGKVYIGCGDYDTNKGPVTVWSYDPLEEAWKASPEPLADEHIKRYAILDGTLCILGTDPKGDWSTGSYYTLEGGTWRERRVLPSGIHCFDAIEYGGKTFFGLGVNAGDFPVVVTEDGENFSEVPFIMDGAPLDTSGTPVVRVYNFVVYDGELYAFLTNGDESSVYYEVYQYDGERFCYYSSPPEVFLRNCDITYTGTFGGLATFVNGYCYYISEDMTDFRPWRVEMSDFACDVMVMGDTQYVLAHTVLEEEEGYETAVYYSTDGKTFTKLFYFYDEIPANSFVYSDGVFYFSMGRYYDGDSTEMGRVYALNYTIDKK